MIESRTAAKAESENDQKLKQRFIIDHWRSKIAYHLSFYVISVCAFHSESMSVYQNHGDHLNKE